LTQINAISTHFNAIFTPFSRHFNAISSPCSRHFHVMSSPFSRHFHVMSSPFSRHFHAILGASLECIFLDEFVQIVESRLRKHRRDVDEERPTLAAPLVSLAGLCEGAHFNAVSRHFRRVDSRCLIAILTLF
jgi:hypothetical protein